MCPCSKRIKPVSLLCCLLCLLISPFLTAQAGERAGFGSRSGKSPLICIEALGRFQACLPASLFKKARHDEQGLATYRPGRVSTLAYRRQFQRRKGCDSVAKLNQREKRRRILSSLIGTEIPDLSLRYNGLKLGLDISTDLTGIEYNGVRLDYSFCW